MVQEQSDEKRYKILNFLFLISAMTLTPEEHIRYGRQIVIDEIGAAGQEKLKAARVFLAGLGGLGSPAAFYLAAAGVGSLAIVDSDRVEAGNLNRQILHATGDIGWAKISSALGKLQALNPACRLRAVQARIVPDNVASLVGDCGIIIDATDNMATRQVLNRAAVAAGIPFIYGGIDGFSGMAGTFIPGRTACFECMFPAQPKAAPAGPVGALGPMAGLVASIQCLEAVKIIVGRPAALAGQLLRIDAMEMACRRIDIPKNPHCGVCGGARD
jgi:molybdopterin/thiamine biosynthesis adenylyltransferase